MIVSHGSALLPSQGAEQVRWPGPDSAVGQPQSRGCCYQHRTGKGWGKGRGWRESPEALICYSQAGKAGIMETEDQGKEGRSQNGRKEQVDRWTQVKVERNGGLRRAPQRGSERSGDRCLHGETKGSSRQHGQSVRKGRARW